ncbi:MAG: pyridoxal-phosphate-dependent aminotransferase family protein [Thermoleophilaceae bacterium]
MGRSMPNPYIKQYLMAAGPTPLPPRVAQVMAEPIMYHRAPAFVEVYARCLERLKGVFQTQNDVLCFASSGSGGMESAAANLIKPGDEVLVASCGKFGERFVELAETWGAKVVHHDAGWGNKVDPADLDRLLGENPGVEVVFTTFSETSTGVLNDIQPLTQVAHEHDALIVVDAISGLGAVPLPQDEWSVDVVVGGSQKALMCPPGLGFASANERALARAAEGGGPRYYFDWNRTVKGQRKDPPDSPFTPAVSLFMALDVALDLIGEEGLDEVFERHRLLGRAAREAVKGLELELFGPEDENSNVVTAIKLPESIDGAKVPKTMRDKYGITIAGGQNQLKGKIARIAHCGYYGAFDIVTTISALEMTLKELGADVELGAGVAAAQRVFLEAGVPVAA